MTSPSRLIPKTAEVTLVGKTYTVTQLPFKQFHYLAAAVAPFIGALEAVGAGQAISLPYVLAEGGEPLQRVMRLSLGNEGAVVDQIVDYDEGLALLNAVIEVHAEDVKKKLMPGYASLIQKLYAEMSAE